ncbi:hypothetical protein EV424DRAFT_1356765 [Suillus variegatus]|nr:hypothetical protein EV424DRAFT_1356765 [Suillus variegatus]
MSEQGESSGAAVEPGSHIAWGFAPLINQATFSLFKDFRTMLIQIIAHHSQFGAGDGNSMRGGTHSRSHAAHLDSTLDGELHCCPPFAVNNVSIFHRAQAMLIKVIACRSQCLSKSHPPSLTQDAQRAAFIAKTCTILTSYFHVPPSMSASSATTEAEMGTMDIPVWSNILGIGSDVHLLFRTAFNHDSQLAEQWTASGSGNTITMGSKCQQSVLLLHKPTSPDSSMPFTAHTKALDMTFMLTEEQLIMRESACVKKSTSLKYHFNPGLSPQSLLWITREPQIFEMEMQELEHLLELQGWKFSEARMRLSVWTFYRMNKSGDAQKMMKADGPRYGPNDT